MRAIDIPKIDPEVINLVNAINTVPGLETTESCCGHGKESFIIFFRCNKSSNLTPVARSVDRRYSKHGHGPGPQYIGWRLLLQMNDNPADPITFLLTSWDNYGETAYSEANLLAARIHKELRSIFWEQVYHATYEKGNNLNERN